MSKQGHSTAYVSFTYSPGPDGSQYYKVVGPYTTPDEAWLSGHLMIGMITAYRDIITNEIEVYLDNVRAEGTDRVALSGALLEWVEQFRKQTEDLYFKELTDQSGHD